MPPSFLAALAPLFLRPPFRPAVVLLALAGLDLAQAEPTFDLPHPTIITATIDGVDAPVVGATRKGSLVRARDGIHKLLNNAPYKFNRAERFAAGTVALTEENANSTRVTMKTGTFITMGSSDMGVNYSAKLTASTTFPKCYAVLVLVNRDFMTGDTDQANFGIFFKNIGNLEAHRPTTIAYDLDWDQVPASLRAQLTFFLLLFNDGAEVQTDQEIRPAVFFRHLELAGFKRSRASYLEQFAAADHPLMIYQSIPTYLPDNAAGSALPAAVDVDFVVTPEGTVDSLALLEPLPAGAANAVRRSVSAWLFLPELENGRPLETPVKTRVPLGPLAPAKG